MTRRRIWTNAYVVTGADKVAAERLEIAVEDGRIAAIGEQDVEAVCVASGRTYVMNGRFRSGWTTRHCARPEQGFHAIQLELAQSSYLTQEMPPFAFSAPRAAALRKPLGAMLHAIATRALYLAA
jgi:N-formylglutamate deformylase